MFIHPCSLSLSLQILIYIYIFPDENSLNSLFACRHIIHRCESLHRSCHSMTTNDYATHIDWHRGNRRAAKFRPLTHTSRNTRQTVIIAHRWSGKACSGTSCTGTRSALIQSVLSGSFCWPIVRSVGVRAGVHFYGAFRPLLSQRDSDKQGASGIAPHGDHTGETMTPIEVGTPAAADTQQMCDEPTIPARHTLVPKSLVSTFYLLRYDEEADRPPFAGQPSRQRTPQEILYSELLFVRRRWPVTLSPRFCRFLPLAFLLFR